MFENPPNGLNCISIVQWDSFEQFSPMVNSTYFVAKNIGFSVVIMKWSLYFVLICSLSAQLVCIEIESSAQWQNVFLDIFPFTLFAERNSSQFLLSKNLISFYIFILVDNSWRRHLRCTRLSEKVGKNVIFYTLV